MAKIYETQKDFERDQIHNQVKDLKLQASEKQNAGLTWAVASTIPDVFRRSHPQSYDWLSVASLTMLFVGLVDMFKGIKITHRAHDLSLKANRMGPERIVLPPEGPQAELEDAMPDRPAGMYMNKITATSLAEHASREHADIQPGR